MNDATGDKASPKFVPVTITLPLDMLARIDEFSEANDMNRSQFIRLALRSYLDGLKPG